MEYNRERDRRLHENAVVVNENAKLAIEKQGQVVQCFAHIAHVLRSGLPHRYNPMATTKPQTALTPSVAPTTTVASHPAVDVSGESEDAPTSDVVPARTAN